MQRGAGGISVDVAVLAQLFGVSPPPLTSAVVVERATAASLPSSRRCLGRRSWICRIRRDLEGFPWRGTIRAGSGPPWCPAVAPCTPSTWCCWFLFGVGCWLLLLLVLVLSLLLFLVVVRCWLLVDIVGVGCSCLSVLPKKQKRVPYSTQHRPTDKQQAAAEEVAEARLTMSHLTRPSLPAPSESLYCR